MGGTVIIDRFITKAEFTGMTAIMSSIRELGRNYQLFMAAQNQAWTNLAPMQKFLEFIKQMKVEILGLGIILGALFGVALVSISSKVREEFESLQLQMNAVFQSAEKGKQAFEWAVDFANRTPFDTAQVVSGLKTMASLNIQPTEQKMKTAGGLGVLNNRSLDDVALAIATAAQGHWSRMTRGMHITKEMVNQWGHGNIDALKTFDEKNSFIFKAIEARFPELMNSFENALTTSRTNTQGKWQVFLNELGKFNEPGLIMIYNVLSFMIVAFTRIQSLVFAVVSYFDATFGFFLNAPFRRWDKEFIKEGNDKMAQSWDYLKEFLGMKEFKIPDTPKYKQGENSDTMKNTMSQIVGKGEIAAIGVKLSEFGNMHHVNKPITIRIRTTDGTNLQKAMGDVAIDAIKTYIKHHPEGLNIRP